MEKTYQHLGFIDDWDSELAEIRTEIVTYASKLDKLYETHKVAKSSETMNNYFEMKKDFRSDEMNQKNLDQTDNWAAVTSSY